MKSGEHAAAAESYSGSPSLGALQNLMTPPAPPVMSCQPPPSVLRFPFPFPLHRSTIACTGWRCAFLPSPQRSLSARYHTGFFVVSSRPMSSVSEGSQ